MIKAKMIFVIMISICFTVVLGGCTSEAKDKNDTNIEASASYYEAQNYEKAIESGKKAVKSSPKNTESHYYLGSSYQAIGEHKLAIDELKKAEALAKDKRDVARTAIQLGNSYSRLGDNDEAFRQYNRALLLNRELNCQGPRLFSTPGARVIFHFILFWGSVVRCRMTGFVDAFSSGRTLLSIQHDERDAPIGPWPSWP